MIPKAVFLLGLAIAASGFVSPPVALALGLVFGFAFPHPFDKARKNSPATCCRLPWSDSASA